VCTDRRDTDIDAAGNTETDTQTGKTECTEKRNRNGTEWQGTPVGPHCPRGWALGVRSARVATIRRSTERISDPAQTYDPRANLPPRAPRFPFGFI
jgi:hypothetical protein